MDDSRPIKILIADDEPLAAERLQLLLAKCDGIDLVGTASDGEGAVRMADALEPELLLLDIAMPGLDGIDVARALANRDVPPAVVFITAFDQFAVAAFEVEAVDYLMKPVDPKRLKRARPRASLSQTARRGRGKAARKRLSLSGGVLGFRPHRAGTDRRPRHRPSLGRARLHAASRRPEKLADPPFDGCPRRGAGSGDVRPAPSLGDRQERLYCGLQPQSLGKVDRTAFGRD